MIPRMSGRRQWEDRWEELNNQAARAHAKLKSALRGGVNDQNAAEILRLQRAADVAEATLVRIERVRRKRRSGRVASKAVG
jgi:hypothetical protein